jgi:hypothetical protein
MFGPIVLRNLRTQFRLDRLRSALLIVIYLLSLITLFFLNYSLIGSRYDSWEESLRHYWYQLLGIQYFVLLLGGTLKVAASVVRERREKRFDFEIMTGMSPASIARGLLVGAPIFAYFLVMVTLPFSLLCLFAGGVDKNIFLSSYLVLLSCGIFFHSWALFASASARTFAGSVIASILFVLIFLSAVLLTQADLPEFQFLARLSPLYLPYAHFRGIPASSVPFLDFAIDLPVCTAIFYLFFAFWFGAAAARRIEKEENSCLSRIQAAFFTATFNFLLAGFLAGKTFSSTGGREPAENFLLHALLYLCANFLLLLLFVFFLTPSGKKYIAAAADKTSRSGLYPLFFAEGSLLFPNYFLLFGIGAAIFFSLFVPWSSHPPLSHIVGARPLLAELSAGFFFILVCGFFYLSLVQIFLFLSNRAGKEIAAIAILLLVLSPAVADIAHGYSGSGLEQMLNPMIILLSILPIETSARTNQFPLAALLFYLFAGILLALLILARARAMRTRTPSGEM